MKNVILVGVDNSQKTVFGEIESKLNKLSDMRCLLNDSINLVDLLKESSLAIIGMSCTKERSEMERKAICFAHEMKIPIILHADTFGSISRPYFREYLDKASLIFVITENEALRTREITKAPILVTGSPLWENYYHRALSRKKARAIMELNEDDKLILVPLGKAPFINWLHLAKVIKVINQFHTTSNNPITLAYHLHRDEKNQDPCRYHEAFDYLEAPPKIFKDFRFTRACDLIIDSMHGEGIAGALHQIPVIEALTPFALKCYQTATGLDQPEIVMLGAAIATQRSRDLQKAVYKLLFSDQAILELQNNQARAFPKPPIPGIAVDLMVKAIKRML